MNDRQPLALIVEDDRAIAQLLATILRMQGYRTINAFDGDAVIAQLATALPQLITLDLNLPGMSGAALLRRLRANPATAELPVIVVSACSETEQAAATSAQAFITKPFELSELINAVQTVAALAPPLLALQAGA
jgi:DNA-binding response OmpR family regulator